MTRPSSPAGDSTPRIGALDSEPLVARIQARMFSQRNLLAGLPLVAALLLAPPPGSTARLAPALLFAAAGVTLRAWSTAWNRYAQGEPKTLATRGPYAWSRNPLYVANVLVLVGCATIAGPLWLAPATAAWALFAYQQVVRHEERRLARKHGAAYVEYCAMVPRWLPRAADVRRSLRRPFPRSLLVQSRSLLLLVPFAAKLLTLLS